MTFLEEMHEIIKDENSALEKLIELSKNKHEILLRGKTEGLENIAKEEENLINRMNAQEKLRSEALTERGLPKETKLLEIIDKTGDENPAFIFEAKKMIDFLSELMTLNENNRVLLEDNLSWVEFNLNLISQAEVPTGYNKEKSENKTDSNIFDKKV